MRYAVWSLLAVAAMLVVPLASACADDGGPLAPGDYILIADHSCSLAFILVDENGIYFATAGHCVQVDQKVVDKNNKLVGVGAFHYLNPETGSESDGSPGQDFALIAIDPTNYDRITPALCGWGGPTGIYEEKPGSGDVHHYGHGTLIGDIMPKRSGTNLANDNVAFYWLGDGVPGDSGSAVLAADGRALGVLTHLATNGGATDNGGTHIDRGMALAAEKGGFTHLRLVLGNEDPVALYHAAQANATLLNASTPVAGPTTTSPGGSNSSNPTTTPPSNGTAPASGTQPTKAGDAETPGAVAGPANAPAKSVPGPEIVLVLGSIAALALRRPKMLK
jgi:hypothetical protein